MVKGVNSSSKPSENEGRAAIQRANPSKSTLHKEIHHQNKAEQQDTEKIKTHSRKVLNKQREVEGHEAQKNTLITFPPSRRVCGT